MATLSEIVAVTRRILDDPAYTEPLIVEELNKTLQRVAAGIRMPDGGVSPPLPDLHSYGTVTTSLTLPYVSLPTDYQREVVRIYDSTGNRYEPPRGGDYYAYNLFLRQIARMDLVEAGEIPDLVVAPIPGHRAVELVLGVKIHDLSEDQTSRIHWLLRVRFPWRTRGRSIRAS